MIKFELFTLTCGGDAKTSCSHPRPRGTLRNFYYQFLFCLTGQPCLDEIDQPWRNSRQHFGLWCERWISTSFQTVSWQDNMSKNLFFFKIYGKNNIPIDLQYFYIVLQLATLVSRRQRNITKRYGVQRSMLSIFIFPSYLLTTNVCSCRI